MEGIDRSACGGTHVRSTSEIGAIAIRKQEKLRGNTRVEFVCGLRALKTARADFRLLQEMSRTLSAPIEETSGLVSSLIEKSKALEKSMQRFSTELAKREGAELHASTVPGADGVRRVKQTGAIDEAMRIRAQAFVAGGKAVFLAVCENPASVLLASSADSGVHAGDKVKAAATAAGGRGGGNQALAQASVPSSALESVVSALA
jgi:alanyl-tRNA synthetase